MSSTTTDDTTQSPVLLLDDVLKGNSTTATQVVDLLMQVRGTPQMEDCLQEMLPQDSSYPIWTKLPLVSRISRRARQRKLNKLLELSTPESSEGEDVQDTEESKLRRKRSALSVLIRTIANNSNESSNNNISYLLSMAKKDAKVGCLSTEEELLKRTPDGLETPKYEILSSKKGGYQIRRYEQFSVCSVTMNEIKQSGSDKESATKLSNPQLSGATSFGALAGYLFGKNEEETAMKMTTPVLSQGEGADRTMSFVLPSDYWQEKDKAPTPLPDSSVKVSSIEGCDRAVIAFSGFGRKSDKENRSTKLREMVEADKDWEVVDGAPIVLANYNDPFTPPWKRRNEVSIQVQSSNKE